MEKYALPIDYNSLDWKQRIEVRLQYIEQQNNKCFYCNEKLDEEPPAKISLMAIDWSLFPKNFLTHKIHLQHDHKTGLTEGAVHSVCNAVMWQYEGR